MAEAKIAATRAPSEHATDGAQRSLRVLIVDDDNAQLLMMGEVLRQRGFSVAQAENGAGAYAMHRDFRPDLVLLDIDMPEMDGFAACAAIRKESDPTLPVVMVTGLHDADSIHRAFAAGATDFITKPINWPLFHHRVEAILAAARDAHDLATSDDRIHSLERLAPELALLVSSDGTILEQLGQQATWATLAPDTKLHALWPEAISTGMRQRISGVLKTRQGSSYQFEAPVGDDIGYFEARFLPDGRNRVLLVVRTVTPDHERRDEAYRLAYYETETQLPNLHLFEKCANGCLTKAALQERGVAILCIAFDRLRDIDARRSDHMAGIFQTIAESVRDASAVLTGAVDLDGRGTHAARICNHQFAILLENIADRKAASDAAEAMQLAIRGRMPTGNDELATPTIGIALFPDHGRDVDALTAAAKDAVAEVPEQSSSCFYSKSVRTSALTQIDLGNELRWAMEKDQLRLHYQPRISLVSGAIVGVEALLRWYHPLRGIVPLDEVLPLAEATGLIVPIGEWVLATACRELGEFGLQLSVNLSPYEFADESLLRRVGETLENAGLEASRLELELTEDALRRLKDPHTVLDALRELGVSTVLDDFGTGLSSLAALKEFSLSGLKIDASFVRRAETHAADQAMCEVIVAMAHKLGLRAIAEGVETSMQMSLLRNLACDEMQGFLVSQPLPFEELLSFISAHDRTHPWDADDAKP